MMTLILAEKPDMMRKIAAALSGDTVRGDGYLTAKSGAAVFTHAVGHLTERVMPEKLVPSMKSWTTAGLPFFFRKIPLEPSESTKAQFAVVRKLLNDSRFGEVIDCCDADREGEAIFRDIVEVAGCTIPKVTRMWINSSTPEGIREAFRKRLPASEYDCLGQAAIARSYADYHVGLNATRLMTCTFGSTGQGRRLLSVGRVQTPTLRIVVDRDRQAEGFKTVFFWRAKLTFSNGRDSWDGFLVRDGADVRFGTEAEAKTALGAADLSKAFAVSSSVHDAVTLPPMLYSLSDLQEAMSAKHGYSATKTLSLVQDLYEKHSMVTYPRTDENHISPELAAKSYDILSCLPAYSAEAAAAVKSKAPICARSVAKAGDKVGSHEALTPTLNRSAASIYAGLTRDEKNVYDAIALRFVIQFYGPMTTASQTVSCVQGGSTYSAKASEVKVPGWSAVGKDAAEPAAKEGDVRAGLIKASDGDSASARDPSAVQGKTNPPPHFTEGTLIKAMKNPAKYDSDKADQAILRDVQGIGTEATRASIIETLKKRGFLEAQGKKLVSTDAGRALIDAIPSEQLKSVALTAQFEKKLTMIADGKYSFDAFMKDIDALDHEAAGSILKAAASRPAGLSAGFSAAPGDKELMKCPCGGKITVGKYAYSCGKCGRKISRVMDEHTPFKNLRISEKEAKELFQSGRTSAEKTVTMRKSGKTFKARLTYAFKEGEKYPNTVWLGFGKEE